MIPSDTFYSVKLPATGIYKEKGSSFLSFIYPFLNESLSKGILTDLKKAHPKARHICYAYHWGQDPQYVRTQDDGEPAGTAGKPILGQIRKNQLENVFIAVVRYFGGTLLGASGLGNAYKLAAADAITRSEIILRHRYAYYILVYSYGMEKHLEPWLSTIDALPLNKSYSALISAVVSVPRSTKPSFESLLEKSKLELQWPEAVKCEYLREDHF